MYHSTTRVLTVLELLQSHQTITGAELARRLEVDIRTIRRYILMLEEMGIPILADRGRHGGYSLMSGFRMPPLMLTEDEALAISLGLLAARHLGLTMHATAVEGALAKIGRVLPEQVRKRVRAVDETVVWDTFGSPSEAASPTGEVVLTISAASHERRRLSMGYRKADGAETLRDFDPYGLAFHSKKWYAIGHCHFRGEQRLFRLDRIISLETREERFERPRGFDVLSAVVKSIGSVPRELAVEVVLYCTMEQARRQISTRIATLETVDNERVLLRGYTDNPEWIACLLAGIGCRFEIREPAEVRAALRLHAATPARCARLDCANSFKDER